MTFKATPWHLCHLRGTQKKRLCKPFEMVALDFLCDFSLWHRRQKSAPRSGFFDHFNTQNHPISLRFGLKSTQGSSFCIYHLPLKPPSRDGPKVLTWRVFWADQRSSWRPWIGCFCLAVSKVSSGFLFYTSGQIFIYKFHINFELIRP